MSYSTRRLATNLSAALPTMDGGTCRDAISSCNAGTDQVPAVQPECLQMSSCNAGTDQVPEPEPQPECTQMSSCTAATDAQPAPESRARAASAAKRAIRRQMHAARR